MWMVFDGGSGYPANAYIRATYASLSSISMMNGLMFFGDGVSYCYLSQVNFISEVAGVRNGANSLTHIHNIANRNTVWSWVWHADNTFGDFIAHDVINDIAMTVLPNAPIDSATNLPIPTIAVATNGGVSVIKDDGSVVDITASSYGKSANITFTAEQRLLFSFDSGDMQRYFHVYDIPSSDISNYYGYLRGNALEFYTARPESSPDLMLIQPLSSATLGPIADYSFGLANGLAKVEPVTGDPASGMVSFITSDYSTGYQVGDIKLAALSDTDDTDVVGSGELVTNGDFSNGTTDWAAAGSGATIAEVNNELVVTRNGTSAYAKQTFNTVAGQWYNVTYTVVSRSHAYRVTCNSAGLDTSSTTGTFSFDFKADAATEELRLHCYNSSTATATFDNISVRLADHDRSVNNNGLAVHGTIDKDPVATGAELVGYSGFSTTDYLEQPYNSDLDFTDTMSVMFWVKDWTAGQDLMHRGPKNIRNTATSFHFYNDGGYDYRFTLSSNGTTEQSYEIPLGGNLSGWQCVCFTLSAGTVRGYLNGKQEMSGTFAGNIFSQSSAKNGLFIGSNLVSSAFGGSLALFRISATAPTAEQIAKIYRDEKPLFQENAKATLYDTSDAVTALAYDDDTGLLHVGNADGRSVFKGLRRVSNTTDAVTKCISALNDLVVED
jgi:hypothetical protein